MLFNTLDTLKRKMVMGIIFFLFMGLTMFVIPVDYIPVLGKALGFCLLTLSILKILDFLSSKKGLAHYIGLSLGLFAGLAGIMFFSIDGLFLALLNWLTGTLPILLGGLSLYFALTYLRRSGRKGWWVFVILSCLLLLFSTILFVNPWAGDQRAVLMVIGGTLFYSAVVYIVCLFWIWPFQQKKYTEDEQ
ncbi:MAG: hypothetical protein IKH38_04725 [Clostridia bacterium]|nr:hypothetical protein [Clostridia bacterium]